MKLRILGKIFPPDLTLEEINLLKGEVLPFYQKHKQLPSYLQNNILALALVGFLTLSFNLENKNNPYEDLFNSILGV